MSKRCPYCRARMVAYRFELKTADVSALSKTWAAIQDKRTRGIRVWNDVHLRRDMMQKQPWALSLDEWTNFHRLKAHGLVIQPKRGHWQITNKGVEFLRGKMRIPKWVKTFRGKRIDTAPSFVGVADFKGK